MYRFMWNTAWILLDMTQVTDRQTEVGRSVALLIGLAYSPRQESNLYHELRRPMFYPLNYEGGKTCQI